MVSGDVAECSGRCDASIVDEDVYDQRRWLTPGLQLLDNLIRSSWRGDIDADLQDRRRVW